MHIQVQATRCIDIVVVSDPVDSKFLFILIISEELFPAPYTYIVSFDFVLLDLDEGKPHNKHTNNNNFSAWCMSYSYGKWQEKERQCQCRV